MNIQSYLPSRIRERIVTILRRDIGEDGGEGLFELMGGVIGEGTLDEPDRKPRIEAYPLDVVPSGAIPLIAVYRRPGSVIFDPIATGGRNDARYSFVVAAFLREQPVVIGARRITPDDIVMHMKRVILIGENEEVPGKLLDPDQPGDTLNVDLPGIIELTPFKTKEASVFAHPLVVTYRIRENIVTGEIT